MKDLILTVLFYWGALLIFAGMAWLTWAMIYLLWDHFRINKILREFRKRRAAL